MSANDKTELPEPNEGGEYSTQEGTYVTRRPGKGCLMILLIMMLAVVYVVRCAIEEQHRIDSCYIVLSDDEIKDMVLDEIYASPADRSLIGNVDRDIVASEAKWIINRRKPLPRQEADSEYDMTMYQVYMDFNKLGFEAKIDKCRNVIQYGTY